MSDEDWAERRLGYDDGKNGRPAMMSNQYYQRGYREGVKKRDFEGLGSPFIRLRYPDDDPDYQPQEKTMSGTVKRSKLFVATVFAERPGSSSAKLDSLKPGAMGGWESFIGSTKVEAINKAMNACKKWRVSPIDGAEYVIYVGTLTEKVKAPIGYELVSLNA